VLANMVIAAAKFALSLCEGKWSSCVGRDMGDSGETSPSEGGEGGLNKGEEVGLVAADPPGGEGRSGGTRGGREVGATFVEDTHPTLLSESNCLDDGDGEEEEEGEEEEDFEAAYDQGNAPGLSPAFSCLGEGSGGDGLLGALPRGASRDGRRGLASTINEEELEERSRGLVGAGWFGGGAGREGEGGVGELPLLPLLLDLLCAA